MGATLSRHPRWSAAVALCLMLALSKYRKRRHLLAMPGCAVVSNRPYRYCLVFTD